MFKRFRHLFVLLNLFVVYFDQQTQHSKMMNKVPFSSCTRKAHKRLTKKNQEKQRKKLTDKLFSSFFFVSLTWASGMHDEKGNFLIIFKCFWSFLNMQMHAQACICWSKNTTFIHYRKQIHSKLLILFFERFDSFGNFFIGH